MDEKTKRVIITGAFSLGAAAISAFATIVATKSDILDKLNDAMVIIGLERSENIAELLTNIENISQENNQLTIDLNEFKTTNTQLLEKNNLLKKENERLVATNEELKNNNNDLTMQVNGYSNLPTLKLVDTEIISKGLSTGTQKIAYIDSRIYYPESLISDMTSEDISLENDILYIGHSNQEKVKLLDVSSAYAYEKDYYEESSPFKIAGKNYNDGFTVEPYYKKTVSFNLESNYSKLNFIYGHVDDTDLGSCKLEIYLDDKLYRKIEAKADSMPSNIEIDLNYCSYIKFEFTGNYSRWGVYGIANPILTR